jgi:L-asparaginase II
MLEPLPIARHLGHHHGHDHSHEHARGGAAPQEYSEPLVELSRGGLTESVHRGAVVVCGPDGMRQKGLGHPAMPTFMRSAAKPLQALPLITTGAAEAFGLTPAELACCCGSLNGEDFQTAAVQNILDKIGLKPNHLACGIHRPSHRPTAKALAESGEKPCELHNNCAGKHAAMLALCMHLDFEPIDYTLPSHPVQRLVLEEVAQWCAYPAEQIGIGIDGCGVPVFRVPLISLAGAYARLAAPEKAGLQDDKAKAAKKLMAACLEHPEMIAGTDRLCTRVMQAAPGLVLAKTGAEGTYALALVEQGIGVGIQVEDGGMRALAPLVTELLHQMGILGHETLDGALKDLHQPEHKNHRGEVVAQLRPMFSL